MNRVDNIDTIVKKVTELHQNVVKENDEYIKIWINEMLLSWRWWLSIGLLILPWVVWVKYRKKDSTGRLALVACFVYVVTSVMDSAGVAFGAWHYNITPLPYMHSFFMPWDLSLFPVTIMFLLQVKPKTSPYIKASIFSIWCAFIAEPFFQWIKLYSRDNWQSYYGLPIYFAIYLISHRLSRVKSFDEL